MKFPEGKNQFVDWWLFGGSIHILMAMFGWQCRDHPHLALRKECGTTVPATVLRYHGHHFKWMLEDLFWTLAIISGIIHNYIIP